MPLISVEDIAVGVKLGLWKIEETVDDFFTYDPGLLFLKQALCAYGSVQRRLEVLAVYSLLHEIQGRHELLRHNADGKPGLDSGLNVSVSHTKGCAAVIVSMQGRVAVDVEYLSDRVGRVARKMLRKDEFATDLHGLMLHWCAKETLYKLYSEDHLALENMRLLSMDGTYNVGTVKMENVQRGETLDVFYRFFDGFVLTYAVL